MTGLHMITKTVGFLSIFSLLSASTSFAAPLRLEVNTKGDAKDIQVSAADSAQTEVEVYAVSKGNTSLPVYVYLSGPAGVKAELSAAPFQKNVAQTLDADKGFQSIKTDIALSIRKSRSSSMQTAAQFDCSAIDPELYQQLSIILGALLGHTPTQQEMCDFVNNPSFTPPDPSNPGSPPQIPVPPIPGAPGGSGPSNPGSYEGDGYVQTRGDLFKNTCDKKTKQYVLRLRIKLAGVDPAVRQQGFTLSVSLTARNYGGSMAASIKPESDGRFAPQPLILMDSVGYNEAIKVVQFKGGKPRLLKSIRVEDYVYYRGHFLSRGLVGSVLRGGKGVFAPSNGYAMYSVCMNLSRSRQRVNGYPG